MLLGQVHHSHLLLLAAALLRLACLLADYGPVTALTALALTALVLVGILALVVWFGENYPPPPRARRARAAR